MLTVVIIGSGNVAENLFYALESSTTAKVVQLVGRNQEALQKFSNKVEVSVDFKELKTADVFIIAVSDKAIQEVSEKIVGNGLIVHTSGATPMDNLQQENRGVFYPLQTFTKGRQLRFDKIPICIEASNSTSLEVLRKLGESISNKVYEIDSTQRKQLHLAAVFANNFSNHLFHIAETICDQNGVSFELLKPLILETVKKLDELSPAKAQTGPASRNDTESMKKHLELLDRNDHKKIYALMSEAISQSYEKEL